MRDPKWTYYFNNELTDGSVEAYCSLACVKDFNDIPKGNKKIIIELVE